YLRFVVRFHRHRRERLPIWRADAGTRLPIQVGVYDAFPRCQFASGEKAGAAVTHREERLAAHCPLEAEAEEIGCILPEKAVDANVVVDRFAGPGKPPMECHHRIQQSINRLPPGFEVNAEITGEEQIRLPCFDGDASRYPPSVEIPSAGLNIMLGDHAPRPKR